MRMVAIQDTSSNRKWSCFGATAWYSMTRACKRRCSNTYAYTRSIDALPVEVSDSPACNLLSLEHPAVSCHSAYDSFPLLYIRVSAITSSLPVVVCSLCDTRAVLADITNQVGSAQRQRQSKTYGGCVDCKVCLYRKGAYLELFHSNKNTK
jgi:hypothetical protein